jgi:hypothetical protein
MAAVTALVPSATAASTAIIDLRISTFSVVLDASQRRLRKMVAARAIEQMARCYSFLNFLQQSMQ